MKLKIYLFSVLCLFLSCLPLKAQQVAVKSNLLYDATATINAGVEIGLAPRWTLDVSGNFNGWTLSHQRRWKHFLVQPEARYWFCDRFAGHFLSVHLHGGTYKEEVEYAQISDNRITVNGLNPAALLNETRSYALPLHDEYDIYNRVSSNGFEIAREDEQTTRGITWFNLVYQNNGNGAEAYCPDGYRLPNQRELILMAIKGGGTLINRNHYLLCKTLSSYYYGVPSGGIEFVDPYKASPVGYWVGGFIFNIEEDAVTLNPGSWYYGGTEGDDKDNVYYYILPVRDIP